MSAPPLPEPLDRPGLYLHVPFCRAICPYCDFAVALGDAAKRKAFCDSLAAEIDLVSSRDGWARDARFGTIYFGGGTPSALSGEQLAELLDRVRSRFSLAEDVEICLEANPEDVDCESVAAWRALGVGFLSLGVQSFDADRLRFLGRSHDGARARAAVEVAQEAGFRTVSIDLMFGLPADQRRGWRGDLETALALEVDHLSCYQLTIHQRTAFGLQKAAGELTELDEATQAELFEMAHQILGAGGLDGYEVSNFSRGLAHRSTHNQKYWRHVPYLGLGPSAHSFDGQRRWWNHRSSGSWARAVGEQRSPVAEEEILTPRQLLLERLMLGLRTADGVDLAAAEERYGVPFFERNAQLLQRFCDRALLTLDGARAAPTRSGMAVADSLVRAIDLE